MLRDMVSVREIQYNVPKVHTKMRTQRLDGTNERRLQDHDLIRLHCGDGSTVKEKSFFLGTLKLLVSNATLRTVL